jgi:hypothetical protein
MFKRVLLNLIILAFSIPGFGATQTTEIYGYVDGYWEDVEDSPQIGTTEKIKNPHEFNVNNLNFIVQSQQEKFKSYLNLNGADAGAVDVSNAWVQGDLLPDDKLSVRLGKMYRPFGLYNEILDATPTYIGIEPPELFDGDHVLLTRTTNFMLRGKMEVGSSNFLNYAVTTGNDERLGGEVPIGLDLNYTVASNVKVGVSYYTTGGKAAPLTGYGEGSPAGGVMPWMTEDIYNVSGIYGQYKDEDFTIQIETYTASHDAKRDLTLLTQLCTDTPLNTRQTERFCTNPTEKVQYKIQTYYLRAGYNIATESMGVVTPYFQYDFYDNPETIWKKRYGGDNEAGLADDGKFVKLTLGTVFRPQLNTAIKVDYSQHQQKVDAKQANYGEVRVSFSYFFSML